MFIQGMIGLNYISGNLGFEQDDKKAAYWFQLSADQGDEFAQYAIGIMYRDGNGVPQDKRKGMFYLKQAAEQGYATAQCEIGIIYLNLNRYDEAFPWLSLAAEQGYATAQTLLGYCYSLGNGTKRDKKKAKYWMQKAAEQGNETAIKWLQDHK